MAEIISKIWGEEHWIVNRDYAGKKMVLFKGHQCSLHMHKIKDETFFVNKGVVLIEVDGERRLMYPGDDQLILPFQLHRFTAINADAEIMEFSTHHYDTVDSDNFRAVQSRIIERATISNPEVYITGNRGYLGRAIETFFKKQGVITYGSDIEFIDITEMDTFVKELENVKPKVIIHTAAMSDWYACEKNPELAKKINIEATKTIVNYCKSNSIPLVYLSTDFIFSGKKNFYTESDLPDPMNIYGATKAEAENYVRTHKEHLIIRTGTFYGISYLIDRPVFANKVIRKLSKGEKYPVATDEISTPTLIQDIAEVIYKLLQKKLKGTYNIAGSDSYSRFDYAKQIANIFGLDSSLLIPSSMFDLGLDSKRPQKLILKIEKLKSEGIFTNSLLNGLAIMKSDFESIQNLIPK